jgi:hypothetical protein
MTDLPVACSLSAPEFRARRDVLLAGLRRDCLDQRSLANGLAMRFAPTPGQLGRITEVIELERQCCRFLEMRLTVTPGEGPVWLELIGPPGTRDFLEAELGLGVGATELEGP